MSEHGFDTSTRQAIEAVSRRGSLLTLGGPALTASLLSPAVSDAKNKGNGNTKCKKQVGKCRDGLAGLCEAVFGAENIEECVELFAPCCEFLRGCNAGQALACAAEVAATIKT